MKQAVLGLAALALGGCVVNISDDSSEFEETVPPPPVPSVCKADPALYHVGQKATQSAGQAILRESGARTLRWGPPNSAWTMDFREDRVNVRYDSMMQIVEITCG